MLDGQIKREKSHIWLLHSLRNEHFNTVQKDPASFADKAFPRSEIF
jgi:hypothetical protein